MKDLSRPKPIDQEPHRFFAELLRETNTDKVLDVACGQGGFTGVLKEHLNVYTQIIGIDISQDALNQAREQYPDPSLKFELQDAAALKFPDSTFDLVGCAFSLHHLPEPQRALLEMRRVLKPGGIMLIVEMYRNHLTETQQTETLIHHWAAEIDTALGISHNQTFLRREILQMVAPDQFVEARIFDLVDFSYDPRGKEITEHVTSTIERVLKKSEPLEDYPTFRQRADQLLQRVESVGVHISTRLVIMGKK